MFCLQNTNYELCRSHSNKNVLLKFLGKKRVNYAVWGALQQSMYRIPISNLDDLKDSAHLLGES